jgi:hypothetical protein
MAEAKIVISAQDLASEVFKNVSDAMQATGAAAVTFGDSVAKMGSSFVARVAEGVLLRDAIHEILDVVKEGIASFPDLVLHTIAVGNSLYEMSLKTGGSVENLSALRYVASQTGIDFESFGNTLYKMEIALGSSGAKADQMQQHLDQLGLNLQTLKNEKPDQAFIDIMSALEELPNRSDQAAIGMALFGKGFKDMAGLTQESITDLMQEAKDLGLVMSTETAAAAHAAEIGFKGFSMQLEAVGMEVAATVLPALIAITKLISVEFHDGVEKAGHPIIDLTSNIEAITITMLDWSTVAVDVAQFIDNAFQGTKAMFFDVTAKVVDLGTAFVHLLEMGADLAAKTPLVGSSFLGVRDALKDTNEWLGGFAKGLHDESDGALDAAAKHGQFFDALKTGANDMKANFHDAFTKAGDEIADFAAKSKNAGGSIGSDVEGGKEKVIKYNEAWAQLNATGASYAETVAQINPKLVEEIAYYIEAGAKVGTLAIAYSDVLMPAQVDAIEAMVKAHDKFAKSWVDASQLTEAELKKLGFVVVSMTSDTERAFSAMGMKTTLDLNRLAAEAVKNYDLILASGIATPREIEQAHAKMVAAVEASDTSMSGAIVENAKAAGFQTRGQLQETADRAKTLYNEMKESGLFTTQELTAAWQKAEAAKQVASGMTADNILGLNETVLSSTSSMLGQLGQQHKSAAIAGAIIDTYLAVSKSLASLPWPFDLVAAAGALAVGFENVHKIESSSAGGWAEGGVAFRPMGTDTVPAMLTAGEGILTRDTTARLGGAPAIEALNRGGDITGGTAIRDLHTEIKGLRADNSRLMAALPLLLAHALRGAR